MSRQVLASGTIVCSAIMLYSWAQPSVSEPSTFNCEELSAQTEAASRPDQDSKAQNCPPQTRAMGMIPERFFNLEWGNWGSNRLPDKMEAVYGDLIKQAQESADRDQFPQAIATLSGVPKNSRHYQMAQQLQEDWAREVLRQASIQCQQAQMTTALATIKAIPSTSQFHARAVELQQRWTQQAKLYDRAIAAKHARNWQDAIDALQALQGTPLYNSLPVQELLQHAMTKLYEPDSTLKQLAEEGLPTEQSADISPEVMAATALKQIL